MRPTLVILLALAVALPVPPVHAAEAPAATEVLTDAKGDVRLSAAGQGGANPTPRLGQLDLLAAHVAEAETEFTFDFQVASLDDTTEPPLAESAFYVLHFLQGDVQYAIQAGRVKSQGTGVFAVLAQYDPALGRYYAIESVPITADAASGTFSIAVPRELMVDSHGSKPYPGTALSGFWAESQSFLEVFTTVPGVSTNIPPPQVRDRMPDTGNGTTPVPILLGPVQVGSARLSSPMPTRQSNGEATTFLFTVEARNLGSHNDRYRLSGRNVPAAWKLTLQDDVVAVPADGVISMPVLVTVPFAHVHGSFQSFFLGLASTTDPASHAELELGVRYPKVPQPAGHHNTLYLHSAKWTDDPTVAVYAAVFAFNTEYAWMNPLEQQDGDASVPVPSDGTFDAGAQLPGTFRWTVPLAPDLAIGMDFDMASLGTFSGSFESTSPLLQSSLSGELVRYVDSRYDGFGNRLGGNRTVLANFGPSAQQDLTPGAI
ncbi:MAG: hypothetical protein LC620_05190, partial [Halobacteriales archaeon]|nr:hypothetical protein [Halobacteriales archaeon]